MHITIQLAYGYFPRTSQNDLLEIPNNTLLEPAIHSTTTPTPQPRRTGRLSIDWRVSLTVAIPAAVRAAGHSDGGRGRHMGCPLVAFMAKSSWEAAVGSFAAGPLYRKGDRAGAGMLEGA